MDDTLSRLVDISIVAQIASLLVLLSLATLMTYAAYSMTSAERRPVGLLAAAHCLFLGATVSLSLNTLLPFWLEAGLVIGGLLGGIILGYLALMAMLWRHVTWRRWAAVGASLATAQASLAFVLADVSVLFVSSSVINGALCLYFFTSLWRKSTLEQIDARPFIALPFLAISTAYFVRLGIVLAGISAGAIVVGGMAIAFVLASSCILWVTAAVMMRSLRLDRQIKANAMRDELTGAENRRALSALDDEWPSRAWRRRGTKLLCVSVQVDGMAGYDELLYDATRNRVLQVLAQRMDQLSTGLQDRVFRRNEVGCEFVLWHELDGMTNLERHLGVIERRLRKPVDVLGDRIVPQLSIGHYITAEAEPLSTIVKRSERALSHAKRAAKDGPAPRGRPQDAKTFSAAM